MLYYNRCLHIPRSSGPEPIIFVRKDGTEKRKISDFSHCQLSGTWKLINGTPEVVRIFKGK